MTIFRLPDLGEGLPDAEIHEWFVKEGESVTLDQPLVSMETAKAVVDVPSPEAGIIIKFYGKPGDVIKTGDPLVEYEIQSRTPTTDKGTVVGHLEESHDIEADNFTVGIANPALSQRAKAIPSVRMLAKKLNVCLDNLTGTGDHGLITRADVECAAQKEQAIPEGYEPLRGVRRAMLQSMEQSHREVVPVSIFDEVDINAWNDNTDITVRLIRAITHACTIEPSLNAWFDNKHQARQCFTHVNLGIAMDSTEGLFVPVVHDVTQHSDMQLRETINAYKAAVETRNISKEKLTGATITLSNFGKFAGRFASPIIVPPSVAILAVGRLYTGAIVANGVVSAHRLLPLSLSFDHRAVTGGEATRFLGAVIEALRVP